MAVTKEAALTALGTVYEYALTLTAGPNHTLARDLAVWAQRHWGNDGATKIQTIRRAKNTASAVPTQGPSISASGPLVRFVHPNEKNAPGELSAALETPGRRKSPKMAKGVGKSLLPEDTESEGNLVVGGEIGKIGFTSDEILVAIKDVAQTVADAAIYADSLAVAGEDLSRSISMAELSDIRTMKPTSILAKFGEKRITAILSDVFGVDEHDMPGSGAQRAAYLKQLAAAKK